MDGEFVNNYCLGTEFIPLLHSMTNIPLDIHLMIMNPDRKLDYFSFAPEDIVTVHAESTNHIQKALAAIHERGARAGLAINPATPVEHCKWVTDDGNVSFENAARMSALGANIFVAGTSSLYDRGGSVAENCRRLRQAIAVNQ
jgi:ribulose-phosphate 3-epimerase